jgi:hypothetical protein
MGALKTACQGMKLGYEVFNNQAEVDKMDKCIQLANEACGGIDDEDDCNAMITCASHLAAPVCIYIDICIHKYICININICTYICTHMYI